MRKVERLLESLPTTLPQPGVRNSLFSDGILVPALEFRPVIFATCRKAEIYRRQSSTDRLKSEPHRYKFLKWSPLV